MAAVRAEPVGAAGEPRTTTDVHALARWSSVMRIPIIVSALLPLIVVPQSGSVAGIVVGVTTWLVFLADFVVQERRRGRYLSTGLGKFDLAVVVLTAPWFLLPGAGNGSFVVILRLARLARLLMATRGVRRLFARLGKVAIVAGSVVVVGSAVAYYAEHPTNPGFATIGDSLWWGMVTLTTVGYGDIVPKTPTGRFAGLAVMLTGISVLGLLAGTLATFFHLQGDDEGDDEGDDAADVATATAEPRGADDDLVREVALLREQLQRLSDRLDRT